MAKLSRYDSKTPDAKGFIHYSAEENRIWAELISQQIPMLEGKVCSEFIQALDVMNFPLDRIPQLHEVSQILQKTTGWSVEPVPSLIDFPSFFELLANRKFPAATFIRRRADMNYLQEPDIFHEIFGHTPLLTDSRFAAFTEAYGKVGLAAEKNDHAMLAKLYWFTVEFGLIQAEQGVCPYGAGIVSSPGELSYALESDIPQRLPFDPIEVLRTPYRIDIYQTVYFIIDSFDILVELGNKDLISYIREARQLGMHQPTYTVKDIA
ncbi:MAG: phenylalanine 4-monooxygenase [Pseudohongiellaceae bacterium]